MYTITLTKEQFKELQSNKTLIINLDEPKQEKWIPSNGLWNVEPWSESYANQMSVTYINYSNAGLEYETEEEAIKASKEIRAYARQLKWLSENNDGWTADWNNVDQEKWYITFCKKDSMYRKLHVVYIKSINTIYMSENNAEKLARLLNEGVVEF